MTGQSVIVLENITHHMHALNMTSTTYRYFGESTTRKLPEEVVHDVMQPL